MISGDALKGNLAAAAAYTIFGLNIVFCKDLTNASLISPMALFFLRSAGAGLLFFILSLFTPKEKVCGKDLPGIAAASFIGFFTTQTTFLFGLRYTTSIDVALLAALAPVFTMFIAAIAIKEPLSGKKISGVAISLAGVVFLVLNSVTAAGGVEHTTLHGFILIFFNVLSFSLYLGIFKPLILKYSITTFMKWIFFFSTILAFPLSLKDLCAVEWSSLPLNFILEVAYLVVLATFVAYFLIPYAQKRIRPTLVCMYTYLQPIIATVVSISIGMDSLNWKKIAAAVLVIGGVVIVNNSKTSNGGKQSDSNRSEA